MKSTCTLLALALLSLSVPVKAELQPAEIAILANGSSAESKQLASLYAKQRGVPANQILALNIPKGETLPRTAWERRGTGVRDQVRNWVAKNQLQNKLRCIVTLYDVPLKIGPTQKDSVVTRRRKRLLQLEKTRRIERLVKIGNDFDGVAAAGAGAPITLESNATLVDVTKALSEKLKAAEGRINSLAAGEAKQAAIKKLTELSISTAGLQVIVQNMQRSLQSGSVAQEQQKRVNTEFNFGRGRLTGLGEGQSLLDGLPATIERDTNLIALIERATGIAGSVAWIDGQLELLTKNETHSSFDSELSLVLEGNYPLLRWQPNYLHFNYDGSPLRDITRTMMVCRIDAPDINLAKAIITKSIAVERTGLTGKVYLDARGLGGIDEAAPTGSIKEYDQSLLLAEKMFRDNTKLEVVVNNAAALFQPGDCPDAALYCGWYSLSKYIDAFTWKPGAIGYHMASGEAATIRNKSSQVWCKMMLEKGVAGTYGPVFEPYLLAFPRPNEFFALLCSGKYSYIECIYRTKATNSWTMTTIGDPLYNPFKAKPALTAIPDGAPYQRLFGVKP